MGEETLADPGQGGGAESLCGVGEGLFGLSGHVRMRGGREAAHGGGDPPHVGRSDSPGGELRIKNVQLEGHGVFQVFRPKPNLPLIGPRLGAELPAIRAALDRMEFESHEDGSLTVANAERTRSAIR